MMDIKLMPIVQNADYLTAKMADQRNEIKKLTEELEEKERIINTMQNSLAESEAIVERMQGLVENTLQFLNRGIQTNLRSKRNRTN